METKIENDIFRFVAIRPPMPAEPEDTELNFIRDRRIITETEIGSFVTLKLPAYKDDHLAQRRAIEGISGSYDAGNWTDEPPFRELLKVYDLAYAVTEKTFDMLNSDIARILGVSAAEFVANHDLLNNLRGPIWDLYYAYYIVSRYQPRNMELPTKWLRACHLLTFVAANKVQKIETLGKILNATPLIDKLLTDIPKPEIKPQAEEKVVVSATTIREYKALWNRLVDIHRAIDEIKQLRFDVKEITETIEIPASDGESETPVPTFRTPQIPESQIKDGKAAENTTRTAVAVRTVEYVSKETFKKLHNRTEVLLKSFGMTEENISVPAALGKLQIQMSGIVIEIWQQKDPVFFAHKPVAADKIDDIRVILNEQAAVSGSVTFDRKASYPSLIQPLGIADLKVVKTRLKKYVAGEVAHIENVLQGESKERSHRALERSETIFTESTETEEEQSRDTQTSERVQLKSEAEKTVESMFKLDAGTKLNAKYGAYSVELTGSVAYQNSSKEASKLSSDFAHEVIDKSVARIQKKVKEERVTKNLRETEEINKHSINNSSGTGHVVGIYRWVDMVYEARLYNYGKRQMLQFMIPEPSAYYERASEEYDRRQKQEAVVGLEAPPLFTINSPENITETNYLAFVKRYNVEGLAPPPSLFHTASASLSHAKNDNAEIFACHSSRDDKLKIPKGYDVYNIYFNLTCDVQSIPGDNNTQATANNTDICASVGSYSLFDWRSDGNVVITNHNYSPNGTIGGIFGNENSQEDVFIPITVSTRRIGVFTLNVDALCLRSVSEYKRWQIKTYEAILKAYQAMKTAYEQKLAARKADAGNSAGIVIAGKNPDINRDIEKTELKKQCIRMLMANCQGQRFGTFDAMRSGQTDFEISDAIEEGKYIQFFEQAFEWENMTYIFYPYFWANNQQWYNKSTTYDTDPQFTKFLQAGAARVMLPARQGYELVVQNYLLTGDVWNGGAAPTADDPLFISVADELKNQTDNSDDQEPEDTWEVVVPTTQVYLQQEKVALPVFEE